MGSRQRRKQRSDSGGAPRKPPPPARTDAVPSPEPGAETRSEARNRAVREGLAPLEPGERPWPLVAAAILAVASAAGNATYAVISADTTREAIGKLGLSVLLLITAVGLWRARYWGVLGMQALLGISILLLGVTVLAFAGPLQVVIGLALLVPLGYLFWKLVKLMARIQMPERG